MALRNSILVRTIISFHLLPNSNSVTQALIKGQIDFVPEYNRFYRDIYGTVVYEKDRMNGICLLALAALWAMVIVSVLVLSGIYQHSMTKAAKQF